MYYECKPTSRYEDNEVVKLHEITEGIHDEEGMCDINQS